MLEHLMEMGKIVGLLCFTGLMIGALGLWIAQPSKNKKNVVIAGWITAGIGAAITFLAIWIIIRNHKPAPAANSIPTDIVQAEAKLAKEKEELKQLDKTLEALRQTSEGQQKIIDASKNIKISSTSRPVSQPHHRPANH